MENGVSLQDAVYIILRLSAGLECDRAEALTELIICQARQACGLIRAVETRYASSCAQESSWKDVLLDLQIYRYERYIRMHEEPMTKDLVFSRLLEAMKKDGGKHLSMKEREGLCEELSIRNTLYGMLEEGRADDPAESAEPDAAAVRVCAYTLAVWVKNEARVGDTAETDSQTALTAAILYRLGYLNMDNVCRLHKAVQERMEEMDQTI